MFARIDTITSGVKECWQVVAAAGPVDHGELVRHSEELFCHDLCQTDSSSKSQSSQSISSRSFPAKQWPTAGTGLDTVCVCVCVSPTSHTIMRTLRSLFSWKILSLCVRSRNRHTTDCRVCAVHPGQGNLLWGGVAIWLNGGTAASMCCRQEWPPPCSELVAGEFSAFRHRLRRGLLAEGRGWGTVLRHWF